MQPTIDRKSIAIHRSERICIDISDSVVSVIKLDPQGVMVRAGSAKAPALPDIPDDAYVTDLSAAIKKAAWAAKVSMGFGASCVVGVSIPGTTIQRFRWPDMPTEALLKVAADEMAPYLPSGKSNYHVACEVLSSDAGNMEVMAAAMPEEHAIAVETACKWANFKPKRIDIRENARSRLVSLWCAPIEGAVPSTFAILDAGPGVANIAFYHNGLFHSNRYFTPEFVKLDEVEDFEMLMSVKAGGIGNNENAMRYDAAKLTEEITSAINHFHRMAGAQITCVLLMDDENIPSIEDSLRAGQRAPVLKPGQWVKPGVKRPNLRRTSQDSFLDAFAVGMPSLFGHECRLDLSIPNTTTGQGGDIININAARLSAAPAGPPPGIADAGHAWQSTGHITPAETAHSETVYSETMISETVPQGAAVSVERDFDTDRVRTDDFPIASETDINRDMDTSHEGRAVPIPAGYVELPELPPELIAMGMEDDRSLNDAKPTPAHHESPFDIISAKKDDHGGFPYAMPEDPRPDPSARMVIIASAAIVVLLLIIAVFIPLRTTRALRAELRDLQEDVSAYATNQTIFMLEQERTNTYRSINAIRLDISQVHERMSITRNFYSRLPALVFIPETLEASGLVVDHIVATEHEHEHRIVVSGRTNDLIGLHAGLTYLRGHFPHHYLLTMLFDVADTYDNTAVDADGFTVYTITITVNPGRTPFWLNTHEQRRWP